MNLVVGVVVEHFNQIRAANGGESGVLTMSQIHWVTTMRNAHARTRLLSRPPSRYACSWLRSLVETKAFEGVGIALILCSTFVMTLYHYRIEEQPVVYAAYTRSLAVIDAWF
jgi:hypothetical protein